MTHKDVWKAFRDIFPAFAIESSEWFPNGKDSIRVRVGNISVHQDYIFKFSSNKDWRFETVDSFLRK